MADAEAICEAASRQTMRLVAVKSEDTQASAMVLRARELSVRQRTQLINALRGHLRELGQVAPQGAANIRKLVALVGSHDKAIPDVARECLERLISMLNQLDGQIKELDAEIVRRARSNETARRLMTVPGIGPLIATALVALAPPPETFRRGRDGIRIVRPDRENQLATECFEHVVLNCLPLTHEDAAQNAALEGFSFPA